MNSSERRAAAVCLANAVEPHPQARAGLPTSLCENGREGHNASSLAVHPASDRDEIRPNGPHEPFEKDRNRFFPRFSLSGLDPLRILEEMLEPVNVVIPVLDVAVAHERAKQR
jgi:hypothetical protein